MKSPVMALCVVSAILLAACQAGRQAPSLASSAQAEAAGTPTWKAYTREADYASVVAENVMVPMSDGESLAVHIRRPADADGVIEAEPLPVILTITAYNAQLSGTVLNVDDILLRGYVHVYVDERGTGSSGGSWETFGERAQQDFLEVLEWIDKQDFSNGNVGTWGPSYMGITQFFTAQHQHPSHKAIFAIVPMGDAYRDIFLTGGQLNAGFIPLWGGLVGGLGALPTAALMDNPAAGLEVLLEHITGSMLGFAVPTIGGAALGSPNAYDGEFWHVRSPLEKIDQVKIPTFVVGGLNDLFQRGEPMLYEAVKDRVDARLVIGPWTHLGGSTGEGLPSDNVPSLNDMALQWFDTYLRGDDTGMDEQPRVTQYLYGSEEYVTEADWPHPDARAEVLYLAADGSLSESLPSDGSQMIAQQPLNGLCSMSASQWTAGVLGMLPLPCATDNRINDLLELTFRSGPLDQPLYVNGPIQANVWMSTTALDAGLVVRVSDVHPDGRVQELTNGLLTASMRALDPSRSRYLDGEMIQPWHPYTEASKSAPGIGEVVELNVEVFPSSFVIQEGHELQISVGASDLPHGLPPVPDLVSGLAGILSVYSGGEQASNIVLPVVP